MRPAAPLSERRAALRHRLRALPFAFALLALASPPAAHGQPPPPPAPRNLAQVGGMSGTALAIVAHNGYLFVAAGEAGLRAFDLANPAAPALAATLRTRDGVF